MLPYRGVWKWLPRMKRKRVEAEDEVEGVRIRDVPQRITWGRRSDLDEDDWICEWCGRRNPATRHLFVDLPAWRCGGCLVKTRRNFHFSFGNLAANGICPVGEILNQLDTDDCVLFALTKTAEMTAQMFELLSGSGVIVPTMDPNSLRRTYRSSRLADGIPHKSIDYKGVEAIAKMIEIMEKIGVQDKDGQHTCKIGGFKRVHGYFEDIVTELAKGYPLVVDMMPGSNFGDLMYGEIYRCPFNNRTIPDERCDKGVTMHVVILVGASRWGNVDYFYFLNSYGKEFCFRIQQESGNEIGGIGKMVADDICSPPYKFFRCAQ